MSSLLSSSYWIPLLLTLLPLLLYLLYQRTHASPPLLLLAGASHSGKTVLFYQLLHGLTLPTVPSLHSTLVVVSSHKINALKHTRDVSVMDCPDDFLRQKMGERRFLCDLIVFLVVEEDINKSCSLLFDLLTHPHLQQKHVPLLLLFNRCGGNNKRKGERVTDGDDEDDVSAALLEQVEQNLESRRKLSMSMTELDDTDEVAPIRSLGHPSLNKPFRLSESVMPIYPHVWSGRAEDLSQLHSWINEARR